MEKHFNPDTHTVFVTDDIEYIRSLLSSKASGTWGIQAPFPDTDFFGLLYNSPPHQGDKSLVTVCTMDDYFYAMSPAVACRSCGI